jgi:hypothetical protein
MDALPTEKSKAKHKAKEESETTEKGAPQTK